MVKKFWLWVNAKFAFSHWNNDWYLPLAALLGLQVNLHRHVTKCNKSTSCKLYGIVIYNESIIHSFWFLSLLLPNIYDLTVDCASINVATFYISRVADL